MARTKDPHGAAVKAWEKRRRAQEGGGSGAVTQSSDWRSQLEGLKAMMGTGADAHNPVHIMGAQHATAKVNEYLARAGAQDMEAAPFPAGVRRGRMRACYENASRLVIDHPNDYDFCEGIAYPSGTLGGMAFMHAWAVDKKTGKVVDPTWDKPEECRYYGIRYDRLRYVAHLAKTKMYGVLGGDAEAAEKVMECGGL